MSDSGQRELVGRTHWRRFFAVLVPAFAVVASIIYFSSAGVLAVSFAVSGSPFTVTADRLNTGGADGNGIGLYQYGMENFTGNGDATPQIETVIPNATLVNLCQSVTVGPATMRLTSSPATATNLVSDASSITASNATFTNVNIGQDVGAFSNPALTQPVSRGTGSNVNTGHVPAGTFGQAASSASFTGLRQRLTGSAASLFTLPHLSVSFGAAC
jgi:hypothetical protein